MCPKRSELKEKVMKYANDRLIKKYCHQMNISENRAEVAFTELKKFLFICGVTNEALTPSRRLDEIWHQFILFTGDYMRFCSKFFGRMIHHRPDVDFTPRTKEVNDMAYERAYSIATDEFGELDPEFWMSPHLVDTAKCNNSESETAKCSNEKVETGKNIYVEV